MKKITIILISIFGVAAISGGLYFAWKNARKVLIPPASNVSGTGGSTATQNAGQSQQQNEGIKPLMALSDQKVISFWVSSDAAGAKIFYVSENGDIFETNGKESKQIINNIATDIQEISADRNGKNIIIRFGSITDPKFKILNIDKKEEQNFTDNIYSMVWSPDGQKIAYFKKNKVDDATGTIFTRSAANVKQQPVSIIALPADDFDLNWISPEKILLMPKPSAFSKSQTWAVDLKSKTLSVFGKETSGKILNWNPEVKRGLQSSSLSGGRSIKLSLLNEKGETEAEVGVSTLPNKCVIQNDAMYCGIISEIPQRTVLPDDYLKRSFYTSDYFVKISFADNGISSISGTEDATIDADKVRLSDSKLFFINRYDRKLYSLAFEI